jgi:hypothetical protein
VSVLFSLFGLWFHLSIWAAVLTLSLTGLLLHTAATCPNVQRTFAFTVLVFTTLLGILYPRFGINRFPADLPWEELHQHRVGVYGNYSQPAMLSMRLERSVEFPFEARLNQHGFDGYLFTTHDQFIDPDPTDDRVAFLDHALRTAGIPWEEAGSYPVLFSRRNWIRFTRPDTEWADWVQALKNRDLKNLKSEIVFVRAGSAVKDSHK